MVWVGAGWWLGVCASIYVCMCVCVGYYKPKSPDANEVVGILYILYGYGKYKWKYRSERWTQCGKLHVLWCDGKEDEIMCVWVDKTEGGELEAYMCMSVTHKKAMHKIWMR